MDALPPKTCAASERKAPLELVLFRFLFAVFNLLFDLFCCFSCLVLAFAFRFDFLCLAPFFCSLRSICSLFALLLCSALFCSLLCFALCCLLCLFAFFSAACFACTALVIFSLSFRPPASLARASLSFRSLFARLGPSWVTFCRSWGSLGRSWALLRAFWVSFGRS